MNRRSKCLKSKGERYISERIQDEKDHDIQHSTLPLYVDCNDIVSHTFFLICCIGCWRTWLKHETLGSSGVVELKNRSCKKSDGKLLSSYGVTMSASRSE